MKYNQILEEYNKIRGKCEGSNDELALSLLALLDRIILEMKPIQTTREAKTEELEEALLSGNLEVTRAPKFSNTGRYYLTHKGRHVAFLIYSWQDDYVTFELVEKPLGDSTDSVLKKGLGYIRYSETWTWNNLIRFLKHYVQKYEIEVTA